MNKFDEMKQKVLNTYPSVKSLNLVERVKAKMSGLDSECTDSYSEGLNTFSQTYVLRLYAGNYYFVRFGRLYDV